MTRIFTKALLGASAAALASTTAFAQDDAVGVSVGVDYVSEYVFRGASLGSDSIQPYVEASYGNFTAGAWVSTGIGGDSDVPVGGFRNDEIDLYAGYSVPLEGAFSLDLGVTYYHYPQNGSLFGTRDGSSGSYEVSAAVGFDEFILAPSIAAYYDFTLENFTLEAALGDSVGLGEKGGVDYGLTAGLVEGDNGFSYQWATASLGYSFAVSDEVSVFAAGNYSINSEDDTLDLDTFGDMAGDQVLLATDDDLLWFSAGISTSF